MAQQGILEGQIIEGGDGMDADTARDFADFMDEMRESDNADAWITVHRVPVDAQGNPRPNTKSVGHLFSEPMGAATVQDIIDRIRREFIRAGETKICVRIIGSTKGSGGRAKFNKIMTIEKPNESASSNKGESVGDLMKVLTQMQSESDARSNAFMERLAAMMVQQRTAPAVDPMETAMKMMAVMGGVMGQMAGFRAGVPATPAVDPIDGFTKMIGAFKMFDSLRGGGAPAETEGSDLVSFLKEVSKVAAPALTIMGEKEKQKTALMVRRKPQPQLAPPKVDAPNNTAETPAEESLTEEDQMKLNEMKENLATVIGLCEAGKTPEEAAALILDMAPQEADDQLFDIASSDRFVTNMTLLDGRVKQHAEWFEKLRHAILAEFEPDTSKQS